MNLIVSNRLYRIDIWSKYKAIATHQMSENILNNIGITPERFRLVQDLFNIFVKVLLAIIFALIMISLGLATPLTKQPYILVDMQNRSVLAGHRIHDKWHPASLTKLMSVYVTLDAVRNRELSLGSPVVISARARKTPPSKMGYKKGVRLRVDTALKILVVKSANDISVALAEAVSGQVEAFVDRMNRTAKRLGLHSTHFANPNGLHHPDQYTSAADMAILALRIVTEFPQTQTWFAQPSIKTAKKTHYSYNLLLERFPGTTGMKTGFVCASGYNQVTTVERDGKKRLLVVLGTFSQTERAVVSARILTLALNGKLENHPLSVLISRDNGSKPKNMRSVICSEEARKTRYDPAGGQAVIQSSFLKPRNVVRKPFFIKTGGIDAPASDAYADRQFANLSKIPVPIRRPEHLAPKPIDGLLLQSGLRGTVPMPNWRPRP